MTRFYEPEPISPEEEAAYTASVNFAFGGLVGHEPDDAERLARLAGADVAGLGEGEQVDRLVVRRFPGGPG